MRRFALLLCALATAAGAWAADGPETVSLSAADTSVKDALLSLSRQSGQRILIGPEVTGRITATVENLPLDAALSVITSTTNNRWSRLVLPADRPVPGVQAAIDLVSAADTLAAAGASVQSPGSPLVSVGVDAPAGKPSVTVYLVQTKADLAAIRAAREQARQKAAERADTAEQQEVAAQMSADARTDPQLVRAYSALQSMSPEQIAMLAREYMLHTTPEQRDALGEALSRQRELAQSHD